MKQAEMSARLTRTRFMEGRRRLQQPGRAPPEGPGAAAGRASPSRLRAVRVLRGFRPRALGACGSTRSGEYASTVEGSDRLRA
jgi:hypothetical protein